MSKVILIFIVFSVLSIRSLSFGETDKKIQHVNIVLNTVEKIFEFAQNSTELSSGELFEKNAIRGLINKINSPEELYRIALICNTLCYPGNAGDIRFDAWFSNAYWISINKLAEIDRLESLIFLEAIAQRSAFDGGDHLLLKEIIEKVRERTAL